MTTKKIPIGSIIENGYTSSANPLRYFFYLGTENNIAKGIYLDNGELREVGYRRKDLNGEKFKIVGKSKALSILKEELSSFQERKE